MPYYRKSYRKKSFKKKRSRYQNYSAGLGQLWRDVKMLKALVNTEKKVVDVVSTGVAISSTPSFVLLNGLATGTDRTDRVGDSVKMLFEMLRIKATIHASATGTTIRVILLRDKQTNAALPTASQLFESSTNILSPLSLTWGKRYQVYCDKWVKLNQDFPEKTFMCKRKLSFHTKYGGNTTAITDISTNSYILVLWSDEATNTPTVEYYNRMRFVDN